MPVFEILTDFPETSPVTLYVFEAVVEGCSVFVGLDRDTLVHPRFELFFCALFQVLHRMSGLASLSALAWLLPFCSGGWDSSEATQSELLWKMKRFSSRLQLLSKVQGWNLPPMTCSAFIRACALMQTRMLPLVWFKRSHRSRNHLMWREGLSNDVDSVDPSRGLKDFFRRSLSWIERFRSEQITKKLLLRFISLECADTCFLMATMFELSRKSRGALKTSWLCGAVWRPLKTILTAPYLTVFFLRATRVVVPTGYPFSFFLNFFNLEKERSILYSLVEGEKGK